MGGSRVSPLFLFLLFSSSFQPFLTSAGGQVDCGVLRKGCPCFYPDNLMSHASIAMNLYYQAKGRNKWNCDFRSSGLIVVTDPSYSDCVYTA
ncbi:hypothetical protein MLD38_024247 [Melastoma candidum]|uniref:Uncharacterized protein n=1 Tax=Melastoma candidum TaxID=119954 RepID=A0ACB9NUD4_9MYRT|nr:hypothetical protein MLD38_024247 [Melastoma candidum]